MVRRRNEIGQIHGQQNGQWYHVENHRENSDDGHGLIHSFLQSGVILGRLLWTNCIFTTNLTQFFMVVPRWLHYTSTLNILNTRKFRKCAPIRTNRLLKDSFRRSFSVTSRRLHFVPDRFWCENYEIRKEVRNLKQAQFSPMHNFCKNAVPLCKVPVGVGAYYGGKMV